MQNFFLHKITSCFRGCTVRCGDVILSCCLASSGSSVQHKGGSVRPVCFGDTFNNPHTGLWNNPSLLVIPLLPSRVHKSKRCYVILHIFNLLQCLDLDIDAVILCGMSLNALWTCELGERAAKKKNPKIPASAPAAMTDLSGRCFHLALWWDNFICVCVCAIV